jgi:hypothetical protein
MVQAPIQESWAIQLIYKIQIKNDYGILASSILASGILVSGIKTFTLLYTTARTPQLQS